MTHPSGEPSYEIRKLYASAPPSPASVPEVDKAIVSKLAKRTCEANADAARFTIALQTLRAALDPDDWMGLITMHGYIDAVLAGGSPLSQPPAVAASSPATAVDAVDEREAFQVWRTRQQAIADNRAEGDDWIDAAEQEDGFIAGYRAALQASRQPVTQQAVAEGAGDVSKAVALCEAVSAIYFDDSSDFKPALLSAIRALSPEMEEMLRDDPRSAWQKADEAKDATLATKEPK